MVVNGKTLDFKVPKSTSIHHKSNPYGYFKKRPLKQSNAFL